MGNCQAEAIRLLLETAADRRFRTVRIPPVHELQADDLPSLRALLRETSVLVTQQVRNDYRDLPLGTAQLVDFLPPGAAVLRWPVIRYAGLHPFQAIVRNPADRSRTPPPVPYHDLRTVVAAADGRGPEDPWEVDVGADKLRAVAEASVAEQAWREHRAADVGVADLLREPDAGHAHTINHPGNAVLAHLADKILGELGVAGAVIPPPQPLLGSIYAPVDPFVLAALGLSGPGRACWTSEAGDYTSQEVHETQLGWYRENPEFVPLALQRHAAVIDILGLAARPRPIRTRCS